MAVSHSLQFLLSAFFFLLISFAINVNSSNVGEGGFSVNMFHRDSPRSPLYNPSQTHYQRLAAALRRSIGRTLWFKRVERLTADVPAPPISNNRGEYLMEISLGTPPVPILAVADTGSDIIWTQCLPCARCFSQNAPIFDPSKSSTYKKVPCSTPTCSAFGRTGCSSQSVCQYSISYDDGSLSTGDIAIETVTLGTTSGRPVSLPKLAIGCGHNSVGRTFEGNITGIVGLGRASVSLVKQMGSLTGGKFSYCLAPVDTVSRDSGRLNFGGNAVVSGAGTVSTPIVGNDDGTFYWLILDAVTVGNKKFALPSIPTTGGGNMFIDSGTTFTVLPSDIYENFATEISEGIKLERVSDASESLEYCFASTTDNVNIPTVVFNFRGANVKLNTENVLVRVSNDAMCLAFVGGDNGASIYGNIAQANFIVGYDTQNKKVSFKPAKCA